MVVSKHVTELGVVADLTFDDYQIISNHNHSEHLLQYDRVLIIIPYKASTSGANHRKINWINRHHFFHQTLIYVPEENLFYLH